MSYEILSYVMSEGPFHVIRQVIPSVLNGQKCHSVVIRRYDSTYDKQKNCQTQGFLAGPFTLFKLMPLLVNLLLWTVILTEEPFEITHAMSKQRAAQFSRLSLLSSSVMNYTSTNEESVKNYNTKERML